MDKIARSGFPIVGVIFLALAVFKFVEGESWVVWAILAFIFGCFGVFRRDRSGGNGS